MGLAYQNIQSYQNDKFLYCVKCNTIFNHSDALEDIINVIFMGDTNKETIKQLEEKYPNIDIALQIENFEQYVKKYENKNNKKITTKAIENNTKALWLNISHDCNLRCIYCYGNGGNYNKTREFMNIETARKAIDLWYEKIDKSTKKVDVVFFGGEPLMNKKVLFYAVSYINSLLKYSCDIHYGLTTNGTILDEEILKLFKDNNFNLTLSIDGGREVQNKNRPYANGLGSFDIIQKNIAKLKEIYPRLTARLTLTHDNVTNLEKCVYQLWGIGINNVVFEMVSTNDRSLTITKKDLFKLKEQISNLGRITYQNIINNQHFIVINLIQFGKMIHNQMNNSCSFFANDALKIDPNGDIFKCHRLIGNEEFEEGNIYNPKQMNQYEKKISDKCRECWAQKLCIICPEINYMSTKNIYNPPDNFCIFKKMIIEENLKVYANLAKDDRELLEYIYG